jgi:hypothetical protein
MKINLAAIELKDIIMILGIVGSIVGAAAAYSTQATQQQMAYQEIVDIKKDLVKNRETDIEQSIILERVAIKLAEVAESMKDLKKDVNWLNRQKLKSGAAGFDD